jgi:hypothetical protein
MTTINVDRLPYVDEPAPAEIESAVRDFIRGDFSCWRRWPLDTGMEPSVEDVNSLIQGVAKATVAEVEGIIGELETMRDMLRAEGDRVQREFASYVSGNQALTASLQLVAENLAGRARSTG